MRGLSDMITRAEAITLLRGWIKQAFPVTDHDIIIFGGCQTKQWPRKDVDAMIILRDLDWIDSHKGDAFQKLIWETGEKLWRHTERRVAGDIWVYIPERRQLWHRGYHLDGYAKDVYHMTEETFPGCDPTLPHSIFGHVEDILKAREIYPY